MTHLSENNLGLKEHEPIIAVAVTGAWYGSMTQVAVAACSCGWTSQLATNDRDSSQQEYDREHGVYIWTPS